MKAKMGSPRRKSLMSGSTHKFPDKTEDEVRLNFAGDANTSDFLSMMAGLVIAFIMIATPLSNAGAAIAPHAEDAGSGLTIQPLVLADEKTWMAPKDGLLPPDQKFALAWAAAADARAAAAPLRALPTDRQHELTTMAPAEPSDLTIGLRFTAPIYLAFFKLPTAPDPMPLTTGPKSIWAGFGIFLIMLMFTITTLTPTTNRALCREDC